MDHGIEDVATSGARPACHRSGSYPGRLAPTPAIPRDPPPRPGPQETAAPGHQVALPDPRGPGRLSLRLIKADTAFQDEALYLWAGHREIAHLLHGIPVPPFPTYFSGAPVIYPLFGALRNSIGGLSAARILSLVFMLGATGLLWSTTRLLYGEIAAFFAAALFAIAGPTLHLGSFATYDAMSVFLVALSAWCVVKASRASETRPGQNEPAKRNQPEQRHRLDDRRRPRPRGRQRHRLLNSPVRPGRDPARLHHQRGTATPTLALRRCLTC